MVCFWCHDAETDGPVVLTDYNPCPSCREEFEGKIVIMEVDMADKLGQPPMLNTPMAPTGAYIVANASIVDMFSRLNDAQKAQVREQGRMMMEPAIYEQFRKEVMSHEAVH